MTVAARDTHVEESMRLTESVLARVRECLQRDRIIMNRSHDFLRDAHIALRASPSTERCINSEMSRSIAFSVPPGESTRPHPVAFDGRGRLRI